MGKEKAGHGRFSWKQEARGGAGAREGEREGK